jgi:hypothetical protein
MRDNVLRSSDPCVGLDPPSVSRGRMKGLALRSSTLVLAFAKPPSVLRGREHDKEEKRIELEIQQMIALELIFI